MKHSVFVVKAFLQHAEDLFLSLLPKNPQALPGNINCVARYYESVFNKKQAFISLNSHFPSSPITPPGSFNTVTLLSQNPVAAPLATASFPVRKHF